MIYRIKYLYTLIVLDNAGLELLSDFALVFGLLHKFPTLTVHLHSKWHPTFISDTTRNDISDAINLLQSHKEGAFSKFGHELNEFIRSNRLIVHDHMAWTNPILFHQLPTDVTDELETSNLVIFKGDANYRRLVLDTKWSNDISFTEATGYLHFPVVALRTLKAELCVGVTAQKMEEAERKDKNWQVNGNWGVIQFSYLQ